MGPSNTSIDPSNFLDLPRNEIDEIHSILEKALKCFSLGENHDEDCITQDLFMFLSTRDKPRGDEFKFVPQSIRNQVGRPDLGVWCKIKYNTDIIMDIEAKCLSRQKFNYVKGSKKNGAIERFKINKHGREHNHGVILGYVMDNSFTYWVNRINKKIEELRGDALWSEDVEIDNLVCLDDNVGKTASTHTREPENEKDTPPIAITHLWRKFTSD